MPKHCVRFKTVRTKYGLAKRCADFAGSRRRKARRGLGTTAGKHCVRFRTVMTKYGPAKRCVAFSGKRRGRRGRMGMEGWETRKITVYRNDSTGKFQKRMKRGKRR